MGSDVAASREAGYVEHITKPVDMAALEAAMARVAGGEGGEMAATENISRGGA